MRAPLFLFLFSFFLLLGAPRPSAADTVPAQTTVDEKGNLLFEIKGSSSLKIAPQTALCDADSQTAGAIRFNAATKKFEGCDGETGWKALSGSGGGPVGSVIWYAKASCPEGYLPADGRSLINTTYTDLAAVLGTTFGAGINVPNLLGEFVRGFDAGRGVDTGRTFGSWQNYDLQSHTHNYWRTKVGGHDGNNAQSTTFQVWQEASAATGGTETRPRNVALMPCIKY